MMKRFIWWYPKLVYTEDDRNDDHDTKRDTKHKSSHRSSYIDETVNMPCFINVVDHLRLTDVMYFMFGYVVGVYRCYHRASSALIALSNQHNDEFKRLSRSDKRVCCQCGLKYGDLFKVASAVLCNACANYLREINTSTTCISTPFNPYREHLVYVGIHQQVTLRYKWSHQASMKVLWGRYVSMYLHAKRALLCYITNADVIREIMMYVLSGVYV